MKKHEVKGHSDFLEKISKQKNLSLEAKSLKQLRGAENLAASL
jgi:hypothetical protein